MFAIMGGVESKCVGDTPAGLDNSSGRSNGVTPCRLPNTVGSLSKAKLPMPDSGELEKRFAKILVSRFSEEFFMMTKVKTIKL